MTQSRSHLTRVNSDPKPLSSQGSTKQDTLRSSNKNQKLHDFGSVIEEVRDSFATEDDFLKQFQECGIEIQTVNVNEDSEENKAKLNRHEDLHYLGDSQKHAEADNLLDYSKLAKLKQMDYFKEDYQVRHHKLLKKMRLLEASVREYRKLIKEIKNQFVSNCEKYKAANVRLFYYYHKTVEQKIQELKFVQSLDKQKSIISLKQLKEKVNFLVKQNAILTENNKKLQIQLQQVKQQPESASKKQSIISQSQLDFVRQSRKIGAQMESQYRKQSETMKKLNAEIKQLANQLQMSKVQNRKLKQQLRQSQKKTHERVQAAIGENNQKNIESYNKFLQKIKDLQDEINYMRAKENDCKDSQIIKWKQQIKDQLVEIQEFFEACQQKQQKLTAREKMLQRRQTELMRQIQNMRRQGHQDQMNQNRRDTYEPRKQAKQSINMNRMPMKTSYTSNSPEKYPKRLSTQPSSYLAQKSALRTSPSRGYELLSYRPSIGSRQQYERPSLHRVQSNFSSALNCRLNKISSSISSELQSLGFFN